MFLCGQIIYQVAFPMEGQPGPIGFDYSEENVEKILKKVSEDRDFFCKGIDRLVSIVKKLKKKLHDGDIENEAKKLKKIIYKKDSHIKRLKKMLEDLKNSRKSKIDFVTLFSDVPDFYRQINSDGYYKGDCCEKCCNAKKEFEILKTIKEALDLFSKMIDKPK
jgi:hypothetical protein